MKEFGILIATVAYLYNIVYSFVFWGFWWGLLNIILPLSMIIDSVHKFGRIH